MSAPPSATVPAVGRRSPEIRLNSEVLPAPFGPDDGEELALARGRGRPSSTMDDLADPPGESAAVASTASLSSSIGDRRGGARPPGVSALTSSRLEVGAGAGELGLEHRLQQGVVLGRGRSSCP